MEAVLPAMWFIRRQMRGSRGELTLPQFRILVRIRREPEASLSALADHLGASLSTVSRAVTTLVEKGLLLRTDSPVDRRQLSLSITPRGQSVLNRARRAAQVRMAEVFEPLDAEQRRSMIEAMRQVRVLFTGDAGFTEGLGYLEDADEEKSAECVEGGNEPNSATADGMLIPPANAAAVK